MFNHRVSLVLIVIFSVAQSIDVLHAKKIFGSSNRRTSSSSSSSRRTISSGSSNGHITKPTYSHNADATKLSYAPSHSVAGHDSAPPIGWNVPKQQGPPPAYSASNPVGGAKTNIHEPPPAYKPLNSALPNYSASTNNNRPMSASGTSANNANTHYTPISNYRPRSNSTGGLGGYHTPIASSSVNNLHSSYPHQPSVPAGATYYTSSSNLPAGATYHSMGSLPPGATYHNSLPAGATYHPAGHIPAGATYHPSGHVPPGASYYSSGSVPNGATYYPSAPAAVPLGSTFLPAGAALPAGATYYPQPPVKSSSGLGFGTGLIAGGLGGALLGHALTPTQTRVVEHVPLSNSNGNAGGSGGEDRIIIINNGPPGSVTTADAGSGTTVINTGSAQAAAATPSSIASNSAPAQDASRLATAASTGATPLAAAAPVAAAAAPDPNAATPEPGGIICIPIRVPQRDPDDSAKTIEVEQIACYPAPSTEVSVASGTNTQSAASAAASTAPTAISADGSSLNATTPINIPEGSVPLAPFQTSTQPDIMKMPGEVLVNQRLTSAQLSAESGLHAANSGNHLVEYGFTTILALISAYYLH